MISEAPISFVIVCALAFLITGTFWYGKFKLQLSLLKDENQAVKDRLNLEGVQNTRYSARSNEQLRKITLEMSASILALSMKEKASSAASLNELIFRQRQVAAETPDTKSPEFAQKMNQAQAEWMRKYEQSSRSVVNAYAVQFQSDVALLMEEMLSRLPEAYRKKYPPIYFAHSPVNPLAVEEMAKILETTAKLLP
jgi:hypothetical protein